jgi:hypothetical protein
MANVAIEPGLGGVINSAHAALAVLRHRTTFRADHAQTESWPVPGRDRDAPMMRCDL